MRAALALTLALTIACGTVTISEDGRHPVTLTVVDSLTPATVGGHSIGARTVSMSEIVILPEYATFTPLVAHELCHTVQWRQLGAAGFLITYAHQVLTFGYWDAPLEVECRAAEGDEWYLAWADDLIGTLDWR